MSGNGENGSRKYLYAVVSDSADPFCADCGIEGQTIYTISDGRVAAVVSDLSYTKIRPERRNLAAHQNVLKQIMQRTTLLPMTFGIIADDSKEIRKFLSLNRSAFLKQLQRMEGKVEMGLRVSWDVPNIFEYFIRTHPELRAGRDRLLGFHGIPTHEDKIELGRLFEQTLNADRESHTAKVEEILTPCCAEMKLNKPRNEVEVMNLCCLVGRERKDDFEAAIFESARLFDDHFVFDFNGPWAPHNFVDIELKS